MRSGDVDTIALPPLGEDSDGMEEMEEMELELDEDDFHSDVHNLLRTTRATQREHDRKIEAYLVLSRLFAALGHHVLFFFLPLALINMFPGTLVPVAAVALFSSVVEACALPYVGRWVDTMNRMLLVHIGTLGRIISIIFIVAIMWCLSTLFHSGTSGPFSTNATGMLLVIALAGMSVLWSLSASVLRVAIEEEWVHVIYPAAFHSRVRSLMQYAYQFACVVAPITAGVVMEFPPLPDTTLVLLILIPVAVIPEYILLRVVHHERPELKGSRSHLNDSTLSAEALYGGFPLIVAVRSWKTLRSGLFGMLVVAGALLSFSLATFEFATLIAYLGTRSELSPQTIGLFRSALAVSCIAASLMSPALRRRNGVLTLNRLFIVLGTVTLSAGAAFYFGRFYVFLALLVVGFGAVYGYEDGSKKMLEKSNYATMHGYEAARQLSGFLFLLVVAAISSPAWYIGAIGASTACCMVAAVLYWIWSGRKESSQLVAIERELDVPTPVSAHDDDEWND